MMRCPSIGKHGQSDGKEHHKAKRSSVALPKPLFSIYSRDQWCAVTHYILHTFYSHGQIIDQEPVSQSKIGVLAI